MATNNVPRGVTAELAKGAAAVRGLILAVHEATERQFEGITNEDGNFDDADPRDYALFANIIEESLRRNLDDASSAHRAGYIRGLAVLISRIADDVCAPDMKSWDPLSVTEAAFVAATGARETLTRITAR